MAHCRQDAELERDLSPKLFMWSIDDNAMLFELDNGGAFEQKVSARRKNRVDRRNRLVLPSLCPRRSAEISLSSNPDSLERRLRARMRWASNPLLRSRR